MILLSIKKKKIIPVSLVLEGEYGEYNVAIGVPTKIDQDGIIEIQNMDFNQSEKNLFKISAKTIRNNIQSI